MENKGEISSTPYNKSRLFDFSREGEMVPLKELKSRDLKRKVESQLEVE